MDFENCIRKGLVKRSGKNREMSNSLIKLANIRLADIDKLTNTTLKIESYYEIIKELLTALLASEGYKSYSHECLISFARDKFSNKFTGMEIELIDQLRIIRNDIVYRGAFVEDDFLDRNERTILDVIKILKDLLNSLKNE